MFFPFVKKKLFGKNSNIKLIYFQTEEFCFSRSCLQRLGSNICIKKRNRKRKEKLSENHGISNCYSYFNYDITRINYLKYEKTKQLKKNKKHPSKTMKACKTVLKEK